MRAGIHLGIAIAAVVCLALAPMIAAPKPAAPAPAATTPATATVPVSADALFAEIDALEPKNGASFDPQELAPKITSFREKLEAYTQTHRDEDLGASWAVAVEKSFYMSRVTEWNTHELSLQGLRNWWKILVRCNPDQERSGTIPWLCVQLAETHLGRWVETEPEKSLAMITEVERRFVVHLHSSKHWEYVKDQCYSRMERAAKKLPAERREPLRQLFLERHRKYWEDESIPLRTRTESMGWYARNLYAGGDPVGAAALLDQWWSKYGEKIDALDYYNVRFFVALIGQGDRPTAQRMLQMATTLVEKRLASAEDGLFKGMNDSWYANLPLTDDELRRKAFQFNAENRAKGAKGGGQ